MARPVRAAAAAPLLLLALALAAAVPLARAVAIEKVGNYLMPLEGGKVPVKKSAMPSSCDYAIVGGGAGGIYAAYRLLSGLEKKPSVCVFETTERLGGRIYTLRGLGKYGDVTCDIGAYRYVDGRHTLVQGVVENLLKLKYDLYDPNSTVFRKIVDVDGEDMGFVTFVEELAKKAIGLGMKLFYGAHVTKVDLLPGSKKQYAVTVAGGSKAKKVIANKVIFNVPQRPLFRILQASNLFRTEEWSEALNMPFPQMASKLYLYYDDAWWVYMNRTTGSFNDPTTNNATTFNQSSLFLTPPMRARYHDAHYTCNADSTKCYGLLLFTYAGDNGGTYGAGGQGLDINPYSGVVPRYYWNTVVNPDPNKPYVVLDANSIGGEKLLMDAHNKLVAYHASIGAPIPEPYASTYPTHLVAAVWDAGVPWSGGAWHSYKNGTFGSRFNVSAGQGLNTAPIAGLKPFGSEEIYVANEAFSAVQGWAEGSLIMAENIVSQLGASRPTFLDPSRHDCVLHATYNYNATLCSTSLNPIQGVQRRRSAMVKAAATANNMRRRLLEA